MEIILLERNEATEDYKDVTVEYLDEIRAGKKEHTNDMLIPDAVTIKVGWRFIRVQVGENWYHWRRRDISCLAVDGTVYPLHGEDFVRINCILTDEELEEAKQAEQDKAAEAKQAAQDLFDAAQSVVDDALQRRLDRLDKEYAARI